MWVGMMRRPWNQPVKLHKNTGRGLWMCWLEQAQQYACFLRSGHCWHFPQNSVNQDGFYPPLRLKGSDSLLMKPCRHQFQLLIRIRHTIPSPGPALCGQVSHNRKAVVSIITYFWGPGVMWGLLSQTRIIHSLSDPGVYWGCRSAFWKLGPRFQIHCFVVRGNLSRSATCCDTEVSIAQARRKTVAV